MNLQKHSLVVSKYVYAIIRGTLCFWLGNIPYIFLLLNLLLIENRAEINTLLVTGIVLIPIVLIPNLTACFNISREFMVKGNSNFPLFKTYFTTYKREYKRSAIIGLAYTLLLTVFLFSAWYYTALIGAIGYIFILFIVFLTFMLLILLNFINDQFLTTKDYIKNSIYLTFNYPFLTITGLLEIGLVIYFSYNLLPSLLILIAPGAILLLITYLFRNLIKLELNHYETEKKRTNESRERA